MAVTINDVLAMIKEYDATANYSWALTDAQILMTAPFAAASPAVPSTTQDLVIKYIAAHFITLAVERGGITKQKIGESEESYSNKGGEGFASTRFGQQAKAMDPTRTLSKMDQAIKGAAQLSVVHRPEGYCT